MFERTKIRMSAAKAVDKLPLPKPDRNDLYYAIAHSPMMPAAVAGIKTDALASPSVAAAYLFAAYIDATNRQKNEGYVNHAIMAGQARTSLWNPLARQSRKHRPQSTKW